jgi:hypothetical protein
MAMAHSLPVPVEKFIAHFIIKTGPHQLAQQRVRRDDLTRIGAAPVKAPRCESG